MLGMNVRICGIRAMERMCAQARARFILSSERVLGNQNPSWAGIAQLIVFGLAVHSVAGSIPLWGNFPVQGIFPLELSWVQTPFPQKLFWMRV